MGLFKSSASFSTPPPGPLPERGVIPVPPTACLGVPAAAAEASSPQTGTPDGYLQRIWTRTAPRPENVAPLTGLTAFLYGLLPGIGGSAITVLSIFSAVWCLLYLLVQRPRPAFTRQHRTVLLGFAFFALTTLVSGLVRKNPWGGFVRAVNDFQFLYSLIPLTVLASVGPMDCRRPLARGAAVGAILSFMLGMLQFTVFDDAMHRPSGGTGNSALFGQVCFVLAFFSMLCFPRETPFWRRMSLTGCVAGLAAVVISGSRASALAACVVGVILLGYLLASREFATLRRGAAVALLCGLGLIVSYPTWKHSEPVVRFFNLVHRLNNVNVTENHVESVDQRVIQIRAASHALWRRPWLGYGMQHRITAAAKLEPPEHAHVFYYSHIHFLYLDYATGNGVIGLVALLFVLAIPLLAAYPATDHSFRERVYGGLVLSAGYATLGLAGASLGMDIPNTMFACFTTILAMTGSEAAEAVLTVPVDQRSSSDTTLPALRSAA